MVYALVESPNSWISNCLPGQKFLWRYFKKCDSFRQNFYHLTHPSHWICVSELFALKSVLLNLWETKSSSYYPLFICVIVRHSFSVTHARELRYEKGVVVLQFDNHIPQRTK